MFGLFSDYKTPEQIEEIFMVKRLKAHYTLYSSLIGSWEDVILESISSLGQEDMAVGPWINEWQAPQWGLKELAAELDKVEAVGIEERLEELETKLKEVEVALGNRMIKKRYAEEEMKLCNNTAEIVKQSELNVKNLRRKLKKYPKRLGLLNQKVGSKLLRRRRMYDVIDIIELILPSSLLGASTKKQMIKLIKEQDWIALEPNRFQNINAVKQGINSLKSKIVHFEKEIRDEFCQLLQKPNFESFKSLIDFLNGMPACKERWELCHRKYAKYFKDELDSLFELLSSPRNYIEQAVSRLIGIWFSTLNYVGIDQSSSTQNAQSPTKRPRRSIIIEPSVAIGCLISIAENLRNCMSNWNKLVKYTFVHENNLRQKIADESEAIAFTQQVREALFVAKNRYLQNSIEQLEAQIIRLKEEQLSRLALKHMLQLRISLACFYHDAQAFSLTLPKNQLEQEFECLVDVFLDQNLSSQFDMLNAMIRTSDSDLIALDASSLSKQVKEVLMHLAEVSSLRTFNFANKSLSYDSLSNKLKDVVGPRLEDLDPICLKERLTQLKNLHEQEASFQLSNLLEEPRKKLEALLEKQQELSLLKLDYTSSALSSVVLTYYKHWAYFPEYSLKIKERFECLQQLNYLLNLLKLVSPVTIQFVLSGGFNLQDVRSEDQFNQLENFHDIVLFQSRFGTLRSCMKKLDTFVGKTLVPGFTEKLTTSVAEILTLVNSRQEPKDKLSSSFEKAIIALVAFQSVDSIGLTAIHEAEIKEMEDLVFYHILLNHSKDQHVFLKIGKIKWEEIRDATLVSGYATEMVNIIRTTCAIVSSIGSSL